MTRPMRPATKHWLLLAFLVLSLAALTAFVFWQIGKARRAGPALKPTAMAPDWHHSATLTGARWGCRSKSIAAPHRALASRRRSA
jgi:hypothetical protein